MLSQNFEIWKNGLGQKFWTCWFICGSNSTKIIPSTNYWIFKSVQRTGTPTSIYKSKVAWQMNDTLLNMAIIWEKIIPDGYSYILKFFLTPRKNDSIFEDWWRRYAENFHCWRHLFHFFIMCCGYVTQTSPFCKFTKKCESLPHFMVVYDTLAYFHPKNAFILNFYATLL